MDRKRRTRILRFGTVAGVALLGVCGLVFFALRGHFESGPPQKDMPVDGAMRAEVVDGLIANLSRFYVFPDKSAAMEKDLRARALRGEFDSVTSAQEFARTLTGLLQEGLHDRHLVVVYEQAAIAEAPPGQDRSPQEQAAEALMQQRFNAGLETAGRLRGDLGYIDLHQFGRPQLAAGKIAAAMTLLADTHALIVDLRNCGGGDPDTVMLFASYLFDQRTHLNDVYWRDENRTEERWTQVDVPGRKYGQARKVYLLTSGDTFSGCEDLAYALKNNGRATLVGETTGGGAHAGNPHRLNAHFQVFVPSGRPISPVTHTDWEGTGVAPDIKASARSALDVAQVAALRELIATETDPDWKERLSRRLADLE